MWLNPGDSTAAVYDNEGPHCRNCHTGSSSCNQCHGVDSLGNANPDFGSVMNTVTAGWSSYAAGDAFVHTNAVAGLNGKCVDGGFSFPHRTLGKDMLKDELYGVNFDGNKITAGQVRGSAPDTVPVNAYLTNYANPWAQSQTSETATGSAGSVMQFEGGEQIIGQQAENLDSVCIDCHGAAMSWNGDDPTTYTKEKSATGEHWELLWKGLP